MAWNFVNPLPHGVLASFYLTAGGLLRPPKEDDISREKINTYPPPPPPSEWPGHIYGGLPRPPDLTGKEERTTIGCRRGEIRVTQKLHLKKLGCFSLLFTF
jgi:hypothetical protein